MKKALGILITGSCIFSVGFLYVLMTTGMVTKTASETIPEAPAAIIESSQLPEPEATIVKATPLAPPVVKRIASKPPIKEDIYDGEDSTPKRRCVEKELVTGGTVMVCEYE